MTQQLQQIIDQAWEDRANFSPKAAPAEIRDAVAHVLEQLNDGTLRVAQKDSGAWVVNQWVKKAVLLSFRLEDNVVMPAGANGVNPGRNRIRMALVAEVDECLEAARRIVAFTQSLAAR